MCLRRDARNEHHLAIVGQLGCQVGGLGDIVAQVGGVHGLNVTNDEERAHCRAESVGVANKQSAGLARHTGDEDDGVAFAALKLSADETVMSLNTCDGGQSGLDVDPK